MEQKKEEEQEAASLSTSKSIIVSLKSAGLFNPTIDQGQLAVDFKLKILIASQSN